MYYVIINVIVLKCVVFCNCLKLNVRLVAYKVFSWFTKEVQ